MYISCIYIPVNVLYTGIHTVYKICVVSVLYVVWQVESRRSLAEWSGALVEGSIRAVCLTGRYHTRWSRLAGFRISLYCLCSACR